jgi:hypothetical protein
VVVGHEFVVSGNVLRPGVPAQGFEGGKFVVAGNNSETSAPQPRARSGAGSRRPIQAAAILVTSILVAAPSVLCLGKTPGEARETFERSAFDLFRRSLEKTMTKDADLDIY